VFAADTIAYMDTRKPMAAARKVALFDREIRITLSQAAVEILFETADLLSEGERRGDGYFGSTMITLDLTRVATLVREDCDAASARRVAELAMADKRVRDRAKALAAADAAERAGTLLARVDCEVRARAVGTRVHLDVDVEAEIARARVTR
jgi:hypothetical protein